MNDRPMGHILEQAIINWLDGKVPPVETKERKPKTQRLCDHGAPVGHACIGCERAMFKTALAEHRRIGTE